MYNIDGKDYKYHRFKRWYLNHTWKYRKRKDAIIPKAIYFPVNTKISKLRKKQIERYGYIRYHSRNVSVISKEVSIRFSASHYSST